MRIANEKRGSWKYKEALMVQRIARRSCSDDTWQGPKVTAAYQ